MSVITRQSNDLLPLVRGIFELFAGPNVVPHSYPLLTETLQ